MYFSTCYHNLWLMLYLYAFPNKTLLTNLLLTKYNTFHSPGGFHKIHVKNLFPDPTIKSHCRAKLQKLFPEDVILKNHHTVVLVALKPLWICDVHTTLINLNCLIFLVPQVSFGRPPLTNKLHRLFYWISHWGLFRCN